MFQAKRFHQVAFDDFIIPAMVQILQVPFSRRTPYHLSHQCVLRQTNFSNMVPLIVFGQNTHQVVGNTMHTGSHDGVLIRPYRWEQVWAYT